MVGRFLVASSLEARRWVVRQMLRPQHLYSMFGHVLSVTVLHVLASCHAK